MAITPLPVLNTTDWYPWASDIDATVRIAPMVTANTAAFTSAGTLVGGARNTVDATSGAFTVTLPAPVRQGQTLIVERIDTGSSAVTIAAATGATLRGNATATIVMPGVGAAFEGLLFVAESATSWFVGAGHKPKTWLDLLYITPAATSTVSGVVRLTGDLGGTSTSPTVPGLAGKANLASPAFTGTPTAPTASTGTATTQIASTAFVAAAVAAGTGSQLTLPSSQTASYTLVASDAGKAVEMTVSSANTVTVPPNSSVAFAIGTVIEIGQFGTGQTTIAAGAGVTIQSSASLLLRTQFSTVSLRKRATDTWSLAGDVV